MELFPKIHSADIRRHRWSVAALVASNALPLVGVVGLGWRAFDVVFLYWFENIVIGGVTVLKMITCAPDDAQLRESVEKRLSAQPDADRKRAIDWYERVRPRAGAFDWTKLFFVPFFMFHYGFFCGGHLLFVCVLLGGFLESSVMGNPFSPALEAIRSPAMLLTAAGLATSHVVSYFTNFLGRGEYLRTSPPLLMEQPYPRIMVLHIAIVLSGFLVFSLGSPIWLLVLLVIGKTWLDLGLHLREHRNAEAKAGATLPEAADSGDDSA